MSRKQNFVERCWILVGRRQGGFWYARRINPIDGEPASVEFDGEWVLRREEERGDVVGFYHTHPSGSPDPSARDLKTMRAWVSCFGKPLLCAIESDGVLGCFRFDDDESKGTEVTACERMPRGVVLAFDSENLIDDE